MRVCVTGVGGGCGQSILRALAKSSDDLDIEVYRVDITPFAVGLHTYHPDRCAVLPRPEANIQAWEDWMIAHEIDAIIPGSDYDLIPLSLVREKWAAKGIKVLVSDLDVVLLCDDKAKTVNFLHAQGIATPDSLTMIPSQNFPFVFPCVVKPRMSMASRGFHVCQDMEELMFYDHHTPMPIIQEYLDGPEFTCSVFVNRDGQVDAMCMARRELKHGDTWYCEIGWWENLLPYLTEIGAAIKPRGPLNIQLKLTDHGPIAFELNARCSGSTDIRAHFGYNEPEMLLRHYALGFAVQQPDYQDGFAFSTIERVFAPGLTFGSLSKQKELAHDSPQ